jgi:NADPH:quinone reductase
VYADNGGADLTLPVRDLLEANACWQFVLLCTAPALAKATAVEDIGTAVASGALRVGPDAGLPLHHYPLELAGQAHSAVEGGAVGKVLIDVIA